MAFVPVPRDMSKIKTKVVGPLSFRQIVCLGTAVAIGLPTYFAVRGAIGNSAAVLVMMGVMLPAFFIAMYEKDGQPAEKVLRNIIRSMLFFPAKRPYKTENFYNLIEKEGSIGIQNPKASTTGTTPVCKRPASKVKQKRAGGYVKKKAARSTKKEKAR